MPDAGKPTNNGFTVFEIQFVEFQQFNILLQHFPVHGVHGASIAAIASTAFGIILKFGINQSASWVHDAGDATPPQIKVLRMFQSEGMPVFMCYSGGTLIKIFQFKITSVAAQSIHKRDITVGKLLDTEIIIAGIRFW